jgi:hypothetical protein
MNLKELSILELKALAYDVLSQLEANQNNLRLLNQEISSRNTAPQQEEVAQ